MYGFGQANVGVGCEHTDEKNLFLPTVGLSIHVLSCDISDIKIEKYRDYS